MVQIQSGQTITAINEAAVRTKYLQILQGGIYDELHKSHTVNAAPRLEELKRLLEDAPGKVLLFVGLTNIVDMLYRELRKVGKGSAAWNDCEVVYGGTSKANRARIFGAFQDAERPRIIVADPGVMAHGLNLYAARTVVWYGPTDKAELYMQGNKRAHRPGQTWPVTIVQLVASELEADIYHRVATNTSLQGAMLDAVAKDRL